MSKTFSVMFLHAQQMQRQDLFTNNLVTYCSLHTYMQPSLKLFNINYISYSGNSVPTRMLIVLMNLTQGFADTLQCLIIFYVPK